MKKKKLEKSGLLTFSDFSDLLNQSGRRTVNSDSYIISDLKMEDPGLIIDSSSDDDADVTIVTVREKSGTSRKDPGMICISWLPFKILIMFVCLFVRALVLIQ